MGSLNWRRIGSFVMILFVCGEMVDFQDRLFKSLGVARDFYEEDKLVFG